MTEHISKAELAARNPATEEQILTAILEYLQQAIPDGVWATVEPRGGFINGRPTRKPHAAGVGVPDIIGCLGGQFIGIEVKTKKGTQRESQWHFQHRLLKAGGEYAICTSVEDVEDFLAPIVRRHG